MCILSVSRVYFSKPGRFEMDTGELSIIILSQFRHFGEISVETDLITLGWRQDYQSYRIEHFPVFPIMCITDYLYEIPNVVLIDGCLFRHSIYFIYLNSFSERCSFSDGIAVPLRSAKEIGFLSYENP